MDWSQNTQMTKLQKVESNMQLQGSKRKATIGRL